MAKFRMRGSAHARRDNVKMGVSSYRRAQLDGKCAACHRTLSDETLRICPECSDTRAEKAKAVREMRLAARQCTKCGTSNPDHGTYRTCPECRSKTAKAWERLMRARSDAGLCVDCGDRRADIICVDCRERKAATRRRLKSRRRAEGLCVDCGVGANGSRRCPTCKGKERIRAQRNHYGNRYHTRGRR